MKRFLQPLLTVMLAFTLTSCGYNSIQSSDETTKAAWSEVLNQYKRRADLVPNLVNTVKAYAEHESEVLTKITEARARVGSVPVSENTPDNEGEFKNFESAQRDMSGALSRLLVVAENYPQLKADQNFRDLQAQLEGTENRITVARNRYIDSVRGYNTIIRSFPSNLTAKVFGYSTKPNFSVENEREISEPPKVNFN